jgi:hypothetical protein
MNVEHTASLIEVPVEWTEKYSDEDKAKVKKIIDWINAGQTHEPGFENRRNQKKLSVAARISQSTINNVLLGKYPSPPTKHLDTVLEVITRQEERDREGMVPNPFVQTTIYRTVVAACRRAHMYRNFSVVSAFVGTGKTLSVRKYAEQHSNVYLVEATCDMNASVLMTELVHLTSAVVHKANRYSAGTKAEKLAAVIRALKDTDSLLIVDEAETVSTQTLEYIRRISDKAGVGVVLSGTEKLRPLIKDPQGRFGQISSRVGFWPKVMKGITEKDAHTICKAALAEHELEDNVLNAFWQMCDGSARVLGNALIPGVRDYGLKKGKTLSPELIFQVGNELLGFKLPTTRRI